MEIAYGKKSLFWQKSDLQKLLSPYPYIIIDLGTGDGKLVYELAKQNSQNFYIGVDADRNSLQEYSHKIQRKHAKGGLKNVTYIVANVQKLPEELENLGDEIYIMLPWGSLLHAAVTGQDTFLYEISKIAKEKAYVYLFVNYDLLYEANEICRLGLPLLTQEYIQNYLAQQYAKYQLVYTQFQTLTNDEMIAYPSTWARRLGYGRNRETIKVAFQKIVQNYAE